MAGKSRRAEKKRKDLRYLGTALKLAAKGKGRCAPNPMVGAVITRGDRIVGRGFHKKAGSPHAEFVALDRAGDRARGATLYLNLEPCSHYGRTPPCADKIIEAGIARVVCSMKDPNPLVCGKGFEKLESAGIEVETGLLEEDARRLNRVFIVNAAKGRPHVTIKMAKTLDGSLGGPLARGWDYITGEASRRRVHILRRDSDAVLVGIGTLLADDPKLTVRKVRGVNPVRIVLDSMLRTPLDSHFVTLGKVDGKSWIFHSVDADRNRITNLESAGVRLVRIEENSRESGLSPKKVLEAASGLGLRSLLVEGGGMIFSRFFSSGLVDRICCFIAPVFSGDGRADPFAGQKPAAFNLNGERINFFNVRWIIFGDDAMMDAYTRERLED